MIIVLEHSIKENIKKDIVRFLEDKGFKIREIQGEEETVLAAVGLVPIDQRVVELLPGGDPGATGEEAFSIFPVASTAFRYFLIAPIPQSLYIE